MELFLDNVVMDEGGGVSNMMDLGPPHLPLASFIVLLIMLKFFSESRFVSLDVSEVKVSFWNSVNIGLQAVTFILLLKYGSAKLLKSNIVIPGLADLAGAI
jgi:hypothetical protein